MPEQSHSEHKTQNRLIVLFHDELLYLGPKKASSLKQGMMQELLTGRTRLV